MTSNIQPVRCKHGTDVTDQRCFQCDKEARAARATDGPAPVEKLREAMMNASPLRYVTESVATIQYNMSPQRFMLEVPVEALANLTPQSHQRLHDMLNYWIDQHKPVRVEAKP